MRPDLVVPTWVVTRVLQCAGILDMGSRSSTSGTVLNLTFLRLSHLNRRVVVIGSLVRPAVACAAKTYHRVCCQQAFPISVVE